VDKDVSNISFLVRQRLEGHNEKVYHFPSDEIAKRYMRHNSADLPSLLVLQAVFLVGAHVSKERPERDTLKAMFFRRAKMLFEARVEWNRDYMVQAALLLTWHSDGVEDIAANAWYWVGTAARIATGRLYEVDD